MVADPEAGTTAGRALATGAMAATCRTAGLPEAAGVVDGAAATATGAAGATAAIVGLMSGLGAMRVETTAVVTGLSSSADATEVAAEPSPTTGAVRAPA